MAYQTQRTLAELEAEVRSIPGLIDKVDTTKPKIHKSDYIEVLREHYLQEKYNGKPPKSLELMLQIECPMLCQRYQILKPEEKKAIWESNDWFLEEKLDGARLVIIFVDGEFDFYSRNISVTDFLPISYKDTIYTGNVDKSKIKDEFIIDSEVISTNPNINTIMGNRGVITETQLQAVTALLSLDPSRSIPIQKEEAPLQFVAFDCIWWNGQWLIDKPLKERRKYLRKAVQQLAAAGMNVVLPRSNISNKRQFYKSILFENGEGVVAKNVNSKYIPTSSRRRDCWVKIKRSMSETLEMIGKDTVDAFVTGFEEADPEKSWAGLVGALEFSVYLTDEKGNVLLDEDGNPKVHTIAKIASIPEELRIEMTEKGEDGKPRLKKEWYGKVAEIDGQCISARSLRLKHARIVNWRPDKDPNDCRMDEAWMKSMIL